MKKSIIAAGAASVALAAMPVVGAFAAFSGGLFVDIIQTTIGESCTFARGSQAAHTASVADYHQTGELWTIDTDASVSPSTATPGTDTLDPVTVTPAAAATGTETVLGHSKFYVICNDTDGYEVTVATTSLENGNASQAAAHPWDYTSTITAPASATASYWRITPSDAAGSAGSTGNYSDIANNIISTKESAEDGHDFSVTYSAFAITGQDSGTYKATATYTAAQL